MLARAELEALLDARAHQAAIEEYRAHPTRAIGSDEFDAYLAAPTRLALWRRKRGLAQADLAQRVGIGQSYIAAIERGRKPGGFDTMRAIAAALDFAVDDLVD